MDAPQPRTSSDETDGAGSGTSITSRFLRGLSLGALVGAAIAGSAIWDRLRKNREVPEQSPVRDPGASD